MEIEKINPIVCIGAGPASLTAAYELTKHNVPVIVLEADPDYVGGLSKTVEYNGYCFDIGGHRFYSKSEEINRIWKELLGKDLLVRSRQSRIYYKGKFFSYPLKPLQALVQLGFLESLRCISSFLKAQLRPYKNPVTFATWTSNRFGSRLFNIFFKSYTEKVWGVSVHEISADWAKQRIGKLSLLNAVISSMNLKYTSSLKTLCTEFYYPRKGPGMLWRLMAQRIQQNGGSIIMGMRAQQLEFEPIEKIWKVACLDSQGKKRIIKTKDIVCSAPMREIIQNTYPQPTLSVKQSAQSLSYRDFITVAVMAKGKAPFRDNWIYVHDEEVKVGRIQNYGSWSPDMVPSEDCFCLGLEYFCFEGDGLWNSSDSELSNRAIEELLQLKLLRSKPEAVDTKVVRVPKAYPVYGKGYLQEVENIRQHIEKNYSGLHFVGRNGMHRYNNQDHSMMTGLLTARNILSGRSIYDPWLVNGEAEYVEDSKTFPTMEAFRQVPEQIDLS